MTNFFNHQFRVLNTEQMSIYVKILVSGSLRNLFASYREQYKSNLWSVMLPNSQKKVWFQPEKHYVRSRKRNCINTRSYNKLDKSGSILDNRSARKSLLWLFHLRRKQIPSSYMYNILAPVYRIIAKFDHIKTPYRIMNLI